MSETTGAIGLNLTTLGGITLTSVSYTVSGATLATPITGVIPVDASGATASVLVGALPAGDYTVAMTANDGLGTNCSGSATFHVTAGQTVGVTVPLNCGAATTRGNARINGTFNACPIITSLIVAPLQLDVGGKINVSAAGSDADTNPLTFAWTATGGTFVAPAAASTQFNCSVPGVQTLTVTISDGQGCTTSLSGDVQCTTAEICGNGNVGPGEQCDPPNDVPGGAHTCSVNCQNIAVACGNGLLQPGETCEPPNTATCNNLCQTIVCGDSRVEGSEQCDPPVANLCSASCQNVTFCGNNRVDPGEDCDPPNRPGICDATCHTPANQCPTCTATSCAGPLAACNAHNPQCNNILACIASTGCAKGSTRSGAECYCGAVDDDTCFGASDQTVPQGACRDVIATNSGLPLPLPLLVSQIFFDLGTGVGSAMQTNLCRLNNCAADCSLLP